MSDDRFFDEFADDFYAESLELIAALRRCLLTVEDDARASRTTHDRTMSELARSLHTLKGLTGMVGLTAAANLVHTMEEVLRAHAGTQLGVDATAELFAGAKVLEQQIAAYRTGDPAPDSAAIVDRLNAVAPVAAIATTDVPPEQDSTPRLFCFHFAPSAERAQQGVNVEVVRGRLQSLGDIVSVSPIVMPSGAIAFEFSVLVSGGRSPDESWLAEGITWTEAEEVPHATTQSLFEGERRAPRSNLIRVDLARLDELMLVVGELIMSRARLVDGVSALRTDSSNRTYNRIEETTELLERQLRDLRAAVMRLRLVQMGEIFERMKFVVRDVASDTRKQARVVVTGGNTEIDKAVVERMVEPLLHLVRNAVSHGLETAEERIAAGKSADGEIALHADSIGDMILVQVRDDGRGLDFDQIRNVASERGLPDVDVVTEANVLDVLAAPGFSTRKSADLSSGRGVGMEVVRNTVRDLGGEMMVETEPGRGTCFTIHLPLTLMIVDALLVEAAGQTIAVPQPSLREVLRVERRDMTVVENNDILSYRNTVLPVISLPEVFGHAKSTADVVYVLVIGSDANRIGISVDRVHGLREIVVRSISDPLVSVPGIGGAAELSNGSVTLILDTNGFIRHALERKEALV